MLSPFPGDGNYGLPENRGTREHVQPAAHELLLAVKVYERTSDESYPRKANVLLFDRLRPQENFGGEHYQKEVI